MSYLSNFYGAVMYVRKTVDEWVIQQYTGALYGWEEVSVEVTFSAGRECLKVYRDSQPEYPIRMRKRRVKKEEV